MSVPPGRWRSDRTAREQLTSFLKTGSRLTFTADPAPAVSVVVVVWNQAELSLTCLRALAEQSEVPMEVIIVDNASTDETPDLLGRLRGVDDHQEPEQSWLHDGDSTSAPGRHAASSCCSSTTTRRRCPGASRSCWRPLAVRAPSARSAENWCIPTAAFRKPGRSSGRTDRAKATAEVPIPTAPEFNFERPVDFCSAALLLTPRALFEQLGGFDERYRPAYYEDADYCVRVWKSGHSVVYQPKASAIHYEFGSHAPEMAAELQRARRPIFAASHASLARGAVARRRQRAEGAIAPARPAIRPRHRRYRSGSTEGRGISASRRDPAHA